MAFGFGFAKFGWGSDSGGGSSVPADALTAWPSGGVLTAWPSGETLTAWSAE